MKAGGGRIKGRQFEYQIAKDLEAELGIKFQRVIDQTREAELADLEPVDEDFPFVLELKRYGVGIQAQPAWWDQVCAAANKAKDKYPCLIYRFDRQPVKCRVPIQCLVGMDWYVAASDGAEKYDWRYAADLNWDTFMMVCRELLSDV